MLFVAACNVRGISEPVGSNLSRATELPMSIHDHAWTHLDPDFQQRKHRHPLRQESDQAPAKFTLSDRRCDSTSGVLAVKQKARLTAVFAAGCCCSGSQYTSRSRLHGCNVALVYMRG